MTANADTVRMKTEIFQAAGIAYERCKSNEVVDFRSLCKVIWNTFDNSASLVDAASLFNTTIPKNVHTMTLEKFAEFVNGYGKIKYPKSDDFAERILVDIRRAKLPKTSSAENEICNKIFDRNTIRVLLMYDLPLKSAFCYFIGKKEARKKELADKQKELDTQHSANTHVGAFASGIVTVSNSEKEDVITWADAKAKNLGLELEEFTMFACAYDLIPRFLTVEQMLNFVKKTLDHFPLKSTLLKPEKQNRHDDEVNRPSSSPEKKVATHSQIILFPHFQLLLCFLAITQDNMMEMQKAGLSEQSGRQIVFSKGLRPSSVDALDRKYGYEIVAEFLRDIGVGRVDSQDSALSSKMLEIMGELIPDVTVERVDRPEDKFRSVTDVRQEKLMNVNFILDDCERLAIDCIVANSNSDSTELGSTVLQEFLNLIYCKDDGDIENLKKQHKPVVICDPVPVPGLIPDVVEQLIQGALAHHNLGNGEEAIKFLEAAKLHLENLEKSVSSPEKASDPSRRRNVFELKSYIALCKGNVSQTCNDDDNALRCYIEGYTASVEFEGHTGSWAHLFMNSIGTIAYYTFRFQCASMCFKAVSIMRSKRPQNASAETEIATIYNNEACAFFLMNLKAEARASFEKSWEILCSILGHQNNRTLTVWKNLEKVRRISGGGSSSTTSARHSHGALQSSPSVAVVAVQPVGNENTGVKGDAKKKK